MLTDIQIAQNAKILPIEEIGRKLGIKREDLELYGDYKAKIKDSVYDNLKDKKNGKLVLVTAINPTPAGEGKTTITVGLGQALEKSERKPLLHSGNLPLDLLWGLKAAQQVVDIRRYCQWRISTCILPAICML